jgi:UDP-sulfoquinovose synthase
MAEKMKIIVFGGDGFCGWPTSLYLSSKGHEIIIVDNLSRRKIDIDLEVNSLTPIQPIHVRLDAWKEVSNRHIRFLQLDVSKNYCELLNLLIKEKPDAIIHFAEQRAAPYSMKSSKEKIYTVDNNINATHNILSAIVQSKLDIHILHLGTMGVYGYGTAGMKIPEGYLDINITGEDGAVLSQKILYPTNPGSIYHLTKSMDQLLFAFYNKNDHLRITDLHQGIVWGTQTEQTALDDRLINRFDYDGDYGTVLNRFLMQAAIGYPLTVHGTGGQTRAFIHIEDTLRCIEIALMNPPAPNQNVKIFNQMTETHRVIELAKKISNITGAKIENISNPRNEAAENDLHVENSNFLGHGLIPIKLDDGLIVEIKRIAEKYSSACDKSKIPCLSLWRAK